MTQNICLFVEVAVCFIEARFVSLERGKVLDVQWLDFSLFLSFPYALSNIFMLSYCYISVDNNSQNGYISAFSCKQFVLEKPYVYIFTHTNHSASFHSIQPQGIY